MKTIASKRILGIDPGSRYAGYGFIEKRGNRLRHLASGRIHVKGELLPRLKELFVEMSALIELYQPDEVAIEGVFTHRNANSALKLGHARGVLALAASMQELEIFEYAPTTIKQAIAGTGRADKEQVRFMVGRFLALAIDDLSLDQSDALAIAICHAHRNPALTARL